MYKPNPSFDLPPAFIYDLVAHAQQSLIRDLEIWPKRSHNKPLYKTPKGFLFDLVKETSKEFRFIMPHNGAKSTLKMCWFMADRQTSLAAMVKSTSKSLRGKQVYLFPGAAVQQMAAPKKPTSRNWYNHYYVFHLYINMGATYNEIADFLVANKREAMKSGLNYFKYYLTSLIAHEATHALDVLLSCPWGSLDPTDRDRYRTDEDYYYNCDIEVRANQNTLFWVMEELKIQNPERVESLLGNSTQADNLKNMGILAPTVDWKASNPKTKKIFLKEIKDWQAANPEFFSRTLFKSPPKKKPIKKKPAKKKPAKKRVTRKKTTTRKRK